MKQITIFGASGKVGSLVVEEALRRGYTVVAFVHHHSLFSPNVRLVTIKGDIYNEADIEKALYGSEAVISCLGSWGTPKKDVVTAAMRTIIPKMYKQNIKRIITLTGSGATVPNGHTSPIHRYLLYVLSPFPIGKILQDGEGHMRLLAASTLEWTTIRSPIMNNIGGKGYRLIDKQTHPASTVNRMAVAIAILDQLQLKSSVHQAPIIARV